MAETDLSGEAGALQEYWQLRADPVFHGVGVPRGDGRLVLLLPGLFGNDFYLQTLSGWLIRIGYRTALSTLTVNAGCPRRLAAEVEASFRSRLTEYGDGEVAIIGHSRGGMLGKALLSRLGERCTRFVTIGSPVGGILRGGSAAMVSQPPLNDPNTPMPEDDDNPLSTIASAVANAGRRAMQYFDPDCEMPACGCEYMDDLFAEIPKTTRVTAIYSSNDPVVPAASCPIAGAQAVEVTGTHSGLVFNRLVYPQIAAALQ